MAKQGPLSGQQVTNRYWLGELLGRGGMSAVYKAQDTRLHRPIAVKVMSPVSGVDLQQLTQLFQAEALRLASLKHPGIPDTYDYFEEAGHWFLAMEFIEGETLNDYLQQCGGRLQVDEVLKIGLQLANVLHYLHQRQPPIIFRDLKPANVMIASNGQVFLIDFGIARLFTPGKSQDTFLFLSPGYAAPEQWPPLHTQTTPQSDIYSLGATLHHLLSGTDPVTGPFHFAPLPIQQPAQLASLIAQMVAFDPANRPVSMAEVKDVLQRMIDQTALLPTVSVLLSSSAPTLPTTVFAQPFPLAPALPPTQIASVSPPSGTPGTTIEIYRGHSDWVRSVAWSPDGKYIASGSEDKTVQVWEATSGRLITEYKGYAFSPSSDKTVAWSPDGQYVVSMFDRKVQVWNVFTGKKRTEYKKADLHCVAWSPDGNYIASSAGFRDASVHVWNAATGKKRTEYKGHAFLVASIAWSPHGQHIVSVSSEYDKNVQVWEAFTSNLRAEYKGHSNWVSSVAWSPDGTKIVSGSSDKTAKVWDVKTGTLLIDYKGHSGGVCSVAWSPDGKYIASSTGSDDARVHVWDAATGNPLTFYTEHSMIVISVAWSPDGKYIASGSADNTIHIWVAPK